MPGLDPGIHDLKTPVKLKTWMAGTSLDKPGHDDLDESGSKAVGIRRLRAQQLQLPLLSLRSLARTIQCQQLKKSQWSAPLD